MKASQKGFTLTELMFTILIGGVLLTIGIPNFRDFIRNSRLSTAANDLLADVNLARSEAVKRRVTVTLCKSTDGTSCDTSATSDMRRWIVFVDDANSAVASSDDGNGAVDAGETVLKDRSIAASIDATGAGRRVVYRASGFPNNAIAGNLARVVMCDDRGSEITSGGASAARGVEISATGRAVVSRDKSRIDASVATGGFGGCT